MNASPVLSASAIVTLLTTFLAPSCAPGSTTNHLGDCVKTFTPTRTCSGYDYRGLPGHCITPTVCPPGYTTYHRGGWCLPVPTATSSLAHAEHVYRDSLSKDAWPTCLPGMTTDNRGNCIERPPPTTSAASYAEDQGDPFDKMPWPTCLPHMTTDRRGSCVDHESPPQPTSSTLSTSAPCSSGFTQLWPGNCVGIHTTSCSAGYTTDARGVCVTSCSAGLTTNYRQECVSVVTTSCSSGVPFCEQGHCTCLAAGPTPLADIKQPACTLGFKPDYRGNCIRSRVRARATTPPLVVVAPTCSPGLTTDFNGDCVSIPTTPISVGTCPQGYRTDDRGNCIYPRPACASGYTMGYQGECVDVWQTPSCSPGWRYDYRGHCISVPTATPTSKASP